MGIQSKGDKAARAVAHIVLLLCSLLAIIPFWLLISASLTQERAAVREGYKFLPSAVSLEAYEYLLNEWNQIGRAYLVTVVVTVIGTVAGVLIVTMFAYGLSRRNIPGVKGVFVMVLITILFSGGIVPTYYVYTNLLHIKNTIWALIVPNLLVSGFNIILVRSYMQNSVPAELIEAAEIDGAGEYGIFFKIVFPLARPIVATVGLLTAVGYWNDWTNGLYYITDNNLFSIQQLLNRMNENITFLASYSSQMSGVDFSQLPSATIRMAIAVVAILPIICIYPFFQKYFAKGLTLGAVKG